MSITITSKRLKFKDGSGSFLNQTLIIGTERYDLNCFTDSGGWIRKMKISKDGQKLTVYISLDWYSKSERHSDQDSVISGIKQECDRQGIRFPFTEVTFKFVDDNFGTNQKVKDED